MRRALLVFTLAPVVGTFASIALAAAPQIAATQPEIQRELGQPQTVGQVHTLRSIPEACVRLQGQFTGNAAAPYRLEPVTPDRCAPRAKYVQAASLKKSPSIANGWILNDVIRVPSAACPNQQAAISVWRRQVDPTKIALDGQGRMRIYMKDGNVTTPTGQTARAISLYSAVLEVSGSCQ